MSKESTEAIRQRLLADDEVQYLIRMRAFEIYQRRGGSPGNPADDWFQAEDEVLTFYVEKELQHLQQALASSPVADLMASTEADAAVKPKRRAAAKAPSTRKTKPAAAAAPKKTATKRVATPKSGDAKPRTRKPKSSPEPKAE